MWTAGEDGKAEDNGLIAMIYHEQQQFHLCSVAKIF